MPQTAEAFLEEAPPSAEDFLKESPSAEAFLDEGSATVAQMASATRHTVGVVGRAIAARDFAVAGYDAPDYSQLEDGYQPDESALAPPPGDIEPKAVKFLPEAASLAGKVLTKTIPFDKVKLTSQEVTDAIDYIASTTPGLTQEERDEWLLTTRKPGNLEKITAGAQRVVMSVPESFTSIFGAATLGTGALGVPVGRAVAGGFSMWMASHLPEQIKELKAAIASGDSERITESSGNLLVTTAMVAATGKHALTKPKTPLEQVAPLTADAVAKVVPIETKAVVPETTAPIGDTKTPVVETIVPKPETATPLTTAAVESVKAKEPALDTPAPTPAVATSESGSTPVPAGVPPAKPSVSPEVTVAKPEGERALTTEAVPEHLRPAKSTQAILDSQPATPPPEGGIKPKLAEAPEGGAILGIGGRRPAPPRPVGNTPRGDANWLRIPSALRRVGRGLFTEGARAVLGRTRNQVGQELSQATRRHVDVEQELFGMHEATLRTAVRAIPRQRLDAAMTEASQYFREVENGRPAPALSPEAQSLVDAWFAIGRSTGDIARANNVMVFDPALGAHRPMGHVENYVPRMFTPEVEAVLRDPQADPALFNRLAQEIATARGIALDVAANELRGVAGRFQANDYMANLELARGAQMPEVFYEYNLRNLAARYLPSYSERMAQIIAYGQRLGPRDAPQRQNLWDVARRESEDSYTQEWLNAAEDQGTGFKTKSSLERAARRMQALASATLLSDPTTTVPRNLLSGIAATTEAYGVGRSVRQLREAARMASRLGARELGAIRDDLASFLNSDQLGDSALDNAIRRTSEFTLRASGFTGSENFVRTHNALVASNFARDAAAALAANPASKLSREALAQFQRWNINPEAIITEGGNWRTGPETRRYIRTAVREMQGGYRFDQVPLWANSTAGRFFYQYGRWGVQRSQNIFQNIIRPAIGEDVQFRGQRMTHRDVLPLIRAGALLIGLGETFSAISFGLFGKDRRDSSLSEIAEAWSEDELKAVGLLGERMVNDIIMAGTLGIIGQPLDIMKAAKDQSRFKNPLDPPSAAGVKAFVSLAQRAVDQDGTLTKKDWLDAASSVARGPKNVSDIARHQLGESLYEGQNDQRTLRNAALRWAKETKEDAPIRGGGKDFRKSPTAPAYEAVNEALLAGNAAAARNAADKFIEEAKDKAKARTAVKSSVRARQPFRAGNLTSDAQRNEFMRWAEKNLSAADLEQIKRVQERYEKTASDAGLN